MINREMISGAIGMDTPQCVGLLVIGCVVLLAALRYTFEGSK